MQILCSPTYEKQLKVILELIAKEDAKAAKDFKLYLDTIIMNAPTKAKKYKQSIYSSDENVKDIEYEAYTIAMYIDLERDIYTILAIFKK